MKLKRTISFLAAITATTALAACGSSDKEQSKSDGEITVYSGREEKLVKDLFTDFTKDTGVKVNVRYANSATTATTLLEEGDKTPADVFLSQDAGALGAVSKDNLLAELPDEVLNKVPEQYRAKNKTWTGLTGRARVIVYNPDLVSAADLPKSIYDVTNPKWKSKVGVAPTNASFQTFVTAMRVQDGEDKAKKFLTDLKANDVQTREGNGLVLEDVNKGVLAMGLINHYYWFEKVAESGGVNKVKAKLHYLKDAGPGSLVNVSGVALTKKAANDPDARKLVDYLLNKEKGQKYFAEKTVEYPLVADTKPSADLVPIDQLNPPKIDLNDLDSLEKSVNLITEAKLA